MKRLSVIVLIMLFIFPPPVAAAPKLKQYNNAFETRQTAQILWQLSGLGKPSEQLIMVPDDKLIAVTGNKMLCVNPQGRLLWEAKAGSGKMGNPVLVGNGSIFTSGKGLVAETKINGATGWSFTALPGGKDKEPQMAGGANNILYLPLPYALYALDTSGHAIWTFSAWDSSDRHSVKTPAKRTFIECAADQEAFYAIYADDKGSFRLIAIDNNGKHLWTYSLGDILSAHIVPGRQDKVYVTTTLKPGQRTGGGKSSTSKLNQGRVYCFVRNEGKQPLWQYNVNIADSLTEPVIANDLLYVSGGSTLYALDLASGKLRWEQQLLNLVSPPAVDAASGRIYAGSSEGVLYAINSSGRLDWSRELEGAIEKAPVLGSDGFLYVCTQKGNLYKIRDKANN